MTTMKPPAQGNKTKAKMTKEERRKKYTDIARKLRQKRLQQRQYGGGRRSGSNNINSDSQSTSVCYNCRQPGHIAIKCPLMQEKSHVDETNNERTSNILVTELICYKCGSTEHSLSSCPKRRQRQSTIPKSNNNNSNNTNDEDNLPFAMCFVCNQMGHLASQCPQNTKGIYVNGGCCRVCGSLRHLATDCPDNTNRRKSNESQKDGHVVDGVENLLEQHTTRDKNLPVLVENESSTTTSTTKVLKKKRRVVTF
jgi:zinc finger CCHC domain-containing protein 9